MYPIRLLAEVKCYDRDVPIWAVRNFVGALKDISENYFVADKLSREERIAYQRYTDCGSFFSATGYTIGAQQFALAQGVFLVSYENNPILWNIVNDMKKLLESVDISIATKNKKDFSKWMDENLKKGLQQNYQGKYVPNEKSPQFTLDFGSLYNNLNSIQTSAIAMVTGENPSMQYPVHMLSKNRLPENIFSETDNQYFKVSYTETPRGLFFEAILPEREFSLFFSFPKYVYQQYFAENRMLEFKMGFIRSIELPVIIRNMRRILKLNLDIDWINRQIEKRENIMLT